MAYKYSRLSIFAYCIKQLNLFSLNYTIIIFTSKRFIFLICETRETKVHVSYFKTL